MSPCNECGVPTENVPVYCDSCIKIAYRGKK